MNIPLFSLFLPPTYETRARTPVDNDDKRILGRLASQVAEVHAEFPKVTSAVIRMELRFNEHERRLISLEASRQEAELAKLAVIKNSTRKIQEYDPELTPHGGIRLEPHMWEEIQKKFEIQEAQKIGAEKALEAVEKARKTMRDSITFYISIAVVLAGIVTWAGTHLFHIVTAVPVTYSLPSPAPILPVPTPLH